MVTFTRSKVLNLALAGTVIMFVASAEPAAVTQEVKLDFAGLELSFRPPEGFSAWSKEMIGRKYPAANAPTYVYAPDERGRISIAVSFVRAIPVELDDLAKVKNFLETTFQTTQRDVKWIKRDYATINETRWVHLRFEVQATDTQIHNDVYATIKDRNIVLFNFNCVRALYDLHMATALEKSAGSIKLKSAQ